MGKILNFLGFGGKHPEGNAEPLVKVGPETGTPMSGEPRLDNGSPLWHALLQDPNALSVGSAETLEAKSRLDAAKARDAKAVESCQGLTADRARAVLEAVLTGDIPKAA